MGHRLETLIGISSYNGNQRIRSLLRSIWLRTDLDNIAVTIVDDGSPEPIQPVSFPGLNIQHIRLQENRGISAGWNTAVRSADSEYVVLINDDVIVPSGPWLDALTVPLQTSEKVGSVGVNWHAFLPEDVPALIDSMNSDQDVIPRDPLTKKHSPERREYEKHPPGRVMCPSGQLFAFRRSDYDAIGGFDEGYKSFFEESDFGTSMAAKLRKISVQLNYPMCWHQWSATFGSNPELKAAERMEVSRKRYIDKWSVPKEFHGDSPGPFDFTNPKFLGSIEEVLTTWIGPDSLGASDV